MLVVLQLRSFALVFLVGIVNQKVPIRKNWQRQVEYVMAGELAKEVLSNYRTASNWVTDISPRHFSFSFRQYYNYIRRIGHIFQRQLELHQMSTQIELAMIQVNVQVYQIEVCIAHQNFVECS